MDRSVFEILTEAKEQIALRGWNKGSLVSSVDGSVCALGAVGCAVIPSFSDNPYFNNLERDTAAMDTIKVLSAAVPDTGFKHTYDHVYNVFHFNDDKATAIEDVQALFDKAIANHLKEVNA